MNAKYLVLLKKTLRASDREITLCETFYHHSTLEQHSLIWRRTRFQSFFAIKLNHAWQKLLLSCKDVMLTPLHAKRLKENPKLFVILINTSRSWQIYLTILRQFFQFVTWINKTFLSSIWRRRLQFSFTRISRDVMGRAEEEKLLRSFLWMGRW